MGPDTEQGLKAVNEKADAANEAVSLVKAEVGKLKRLLTQHITAEERAEAAKRETYKKNMYKGE
jgi:hypothetical protein